MSEKDAKACILQAARAEFIEHGYHGARMRAIAERANINKGLLHYYFGSKDTLFEAVFSSVFEESMREFKQIMQPDMELIEAISRYVHLHIDKLIKNPFVPRYIVEETNRDPQRLMQLMGQKVGDSILQRFEDRIQHEIEQGRIRPICPRQLVVSLVAMVVFPVLQRPLLEVIHQMNDEEYLHFLEERKRFIPAFVRCALLPDAADSSMSTPSTNFQSSQNKTS